MLKHCDRHSSALAGNYTESAMKEPQKFLVLCLVGSLTIFGFLECLRRAFGGPWSLYRVILALIVCAAFCLRARQARAAAGFDRS
jgi:hypothetical protein